jgi:hypothetical protein
MANASESVMIVLPQGLLRFAQACANDPDISSVVIAGLKLLIEELEKLDIPRDATVIHQH